MLVFSLLKQYTETVLSLGWTNKMLRLAVSPCFWSLCSVSWRESGIDIQLSFSERSLAVLQSPEYPFILDAVRNMFECLCQFSARTVKVIEFRIPTQNDSPSSFIWDLTGSSGLVRSQALFLRFFFEEEISFHIHMICCYFGISTVAV